MCLGTIYVHKAVVEAFLGKEMDIDLRGEASRTCLNHATVFNHSELAEFLISKGADVDSQNALSDTSLHEAAWRDRPCIASLLLKNGARLINSRGRDQMTPLIMAANKGSEGVARMLCNAHADMTLKDEKGLTALEHADVGVMRILLECGADVHDSVYRNSLGIVISCARIDCVRLLIERGFDVNRADQHGINAIDYAILAGEPAILELLTNHRA